MHCLSIAKRFKTLEITCKISSFVAGIVFLSLGLETFAQAPNPALSKMSLKERVGQVFIWTYSGTNFSPQQARWLGAFQPGALIVFRRNIQSPEQIADYNSHLQTFASRYMKAPFFLM